MIIHSIKVKSWPLVDAAGAGWDIFDEPDITLVIKDGAQVLYQTNLFYEDAKTGQNILFIPELNIFFPDRPLSFEVWDYDDGLTIPDYMGGIEGKIYREGQKFPISFTMQCGGCLVSFEIGVSYYF